MHRGKVARAGVVLLFIFSVVVPAIAGQRPIRGRWIYVGEAHVDGKYDHLPMAAFLYVGSIEEAVEKASQLQA